MRARLGLHPPPPNKLQLSATTETLGRAQIPALTIKNMAPVLNVETNTVLWILNLVSPFCKLAGAVVNCNNSGTSEFFYIILFYFAFFPSIYSYLLILTHIMYL